MEKKRQEQYQKSLEEELYRKRVEIEAQENARLQEEMKKNIEQEKFHVEQLVSLRPLILLLFAFLVSPFPMYLIVFIQFSLTCTYSLPSFSCINNNKKFYAWT